MRLPAFVCLGLVMPSAAMANVTTASAAPQQPDAFVWVLVAASLVLLMQVGFLLLEAGLVRSKNSVNVAQKNLLDLLFSIIAFALVGFMIAFGVDSGYGFGLDARFAGLWDLEPAEYAFFAFQVMFCGTAATIVSGAAAERLRLSTYVICSVVVAALIYPVFAHWVWGGALAPGASAFLSNMGFIDFAGSTVVHSTGAWVSLAACLVLGPRIGRFEPEGRVRRIPGHSAVLATVGAMVIFVGWIGFNGGSTIVPTTAIAHIVANTVLAAGAGGVAGYFLALRHDGLVLPEKPICGLLGGLVAITAGCHLLNATGAMVIGAAGGLIAVWGNRFIERRCRIDDAVGAIGVHGFAGVLGTLGLALLAPLDQIAAGGRLSQLAIQAAGAGLNFVWAFPLAYLLFRVLDRIYPIRVSAADEERGLNQSEHATSLGLGTMETALRQILGGHADISHRIPIETGDDAELTTRLFNAFLDKVEDGELARRASEDVLRAEQEAERLSAMAGAVFEGIAVTVGGRIIDANAAFERLTGLSGRELLKRTLQDVVAEAHVETLGRALATQEIRPLELRLRRADGLEIPAEIRSRTIIFRGEETRVSAFVDLRERKEAEERIRFTAQHDALTGLPNRLLYQQFLEETLAEVRKGERVAALIAVDLDRFKDINDLYGHPAGDAVIRASALRLQTLFGKAGFVARLGGDEFGVILPDVAFANQVADFAFRIVHELGAPIDVGNGVRIRPGASVGFALAPRDGIEPGTVISRADVALYHAKRSGRNNYAGFESGMDAELRMRRILESDLGNAVARNELYLCFQPRIVLSEERIGSYEALVRWQHPDRGLVSPSVFIPIAEQSGKIGEIGEWVLREACRQSLELLDGAAISVNVSAYQLRNRNFVETTLAILEEVGFPPARLELELTESILIEDRDRALSVLRALKRHGIKVALDDFGTGYSSLSYLRTFPFDSIKIDQSFIRNLSIDESSLAIADAVIELGRALDLTIVAEGVETEEQLAILAGRRCDEIQGYLFARPSTASEVMRQIPASVAAQIARTTLRPQGGGTRRLESRERRSNARRARELS
ncbi:EAL domain-containing protein [Aurantimonas sp. HBX-1]|uniref:EAL domain-containing protein n=1 Tax=Aurantimonas sp. HBX-1 TaxID=2906072 RepID=UPI001F402E57|nr:EAL domain-containing protein [Aurantimonas sp. HBX-1]UIJ73967.1 EAL domain-containing protein [Aurantimonas sp. HBX-1]